MSVAVITSVYGNYDHVCDPPPQTLDADWVLVTGSHQPVTGWRQIIEPRAHQHPRLAAKVAKCRPDWYTSADITVWLDGSAQLLGVDALEGLVASLGSAELAMYVHPHRESIEAEAEVSMAMTKYQGQLCREQVASYLRAGHPDTWGLWATGLIVRRATGKTAKLGDRWLLEQMRWSYQDQLSLPPVLRSLQLRPVSLDGTLWNSRFVAFAGHRSEQ